jgi:hypothetical protein
LELTCKLYPTEQNTQQTTPKKRDEGGGKEERRGEEGGAGGDEEEGKVQDEEDDKMQDEEDDKMQDEEDHKVQDSADDKVQDSADDKVQDSADDDSQEVVDTADCCYANDGRPSNGSSSTAEDSSPPVDPPQNDNSRQHAFASLLLEVLPSRVGKRSVTFQGETVRPTVAASAICSQFGLCVCNLASGGLRVALPETGGWPDNVPRTKVDGTRRISGVKGIRAYAEKLRKRNEGMEGGNEKEGEEESFGEEESIGEEDDDVKDDQNDEDEEEGDDR